ncbi:hypothetical protein FRC10_003721 [Ceratobasidium sp. 414]|nr:hypothetical protein FRC10_003721 [Ceratobasidium sp. 414]
MGRNGKRKKSNIANLQRGSKKAKTEETEVKQDELGSNAIEHKSEPVEYTDCRNLLDQNEPVKAEEVPYNWGHGAHEVLPNVAPDVGGLGSTGTSDIRLKMEEMVEGLMGSASEHISEARTKLTHHLAPDIIRHINIIEGNLNNLEDQQQDDDLDGAVDEFYDSFERELLRKNRR